jgi:hypothetical protein
VSERGAPLSAPRFSRMIERAASKLDEMMRTLSSAASGRPWPRLGCRHQQLDRRWDGDRRLVRDQQGGTPYRRCMKPASNPRGIIGTSIGANTGAIIAGNAPADRVARSSGSGSIRECPNHGTPVGAWVCGPSKSSSASRRSTFSWRGTTSSPARTTARSAARCQRSCPIPCWRGHDAEKAVQKVREACKAGNAAHARAAVASQWV